jgi:hypothetical protein
MPPLPPSGLVPASALAPPLGRSPQFFEAQSAFELHGPPTGERSRHLSVVGSQRWLLVQTLGHSAQCVPSVNVAHAVGTPLTHACGGLT